MARNLKKLRYRGFYLKPYCSSTFHDWSCDVQFRWKAGSINWWVSSQASSAKKAIVAAKDSIDQFIASVNKE